MEGRGSWEETRPGCLLGTQLVMSLERLGPEPVVGAIPVQPHLALGALGVTFPFLQVWSGKQGHLAGGALCQHLL